jgi:hypothetical protein
MDAFTQADVVSIISPLLAAGGSEITPFLQEARKEAAARAQQAIANGKDAKAGVLNAVLDLPIDEALRRLGPLTHELAKMKPEDRRFVISACMSLVDKRIGGVAQAARFL